MKIASELISELCDSSDEILNKSFEIIILPILNNNNNNNMIHLLSKSHNMLMKILNYIENNLNQYINNNIHFLLEVLNGCDLLLLHQILIETKYSIFNNLWICYLNYYNNNREVNEKISSEIYSIFEYLYLNIIYNRLIYHSLTTDEFKIIQQTLLTSILPLKITKTPQNSEIYIYIPYIQCLLYMTSDIILSNTIIFEWCIDLLLLNIDNVINDILTHFISLYLLYIPDIEFNVYIFINIYRMNLQN